MTDQPDTSTRRGVLQIDAALLAVALGLPTGTRIVSIQGDVWRGSIDLLVEHPDLPDIGDGAIYPNVEVVVNHSVSWKVPGPQPGETGGRT